MFKHRLASGLALIPLLLISVTAFVQKKDKDSSRGAPVLWRPPANIRSLDLFAGPGGAKPDLRRVEFIEEQKGGYSKKYRVRDSAGREWVAKIGKEAQAETAAVRLIWAMGYMTEINYLEPVTQIVGKGTFQNVRFEARPKNVKRLVEWKWSSNPFVGTRELRGLKVMMALINNWDIKDSNNEIFLVPGNRGNELRYVISDLGATFGKSGSTPIFWHFTRSRNKPKDFADAEFVDVVKDNHVYFHYGSKRHSLFNDITVQDALWIGRLLSQLTTSQL
ncbi:MAG TPA: hypothetical protein VJ180_15330, partial [Pyrinomonadaceae bacterium]|nr:hypothetical protein [Pyrinomonadaceae bacterium]